MNKTTATETKKTHTLLFVVAVEALILVEQGEGAAR